MNWYKGRIRIIPADAAMSKFIRIRDGWFCQYRFSCLGAESFEDNKGGLDCSHFIKRGNWSVRYNPDNCDAACKKCHYFVENDPNGQKVLEEWKKRQLGQNRFDRLLIASNTTEKRDDKLNLMYTKQLLKEQAEEERAKKKNRLLGK